MTAFTQFHHDHFTAEVLFTPGLKYVTTKWCFLKSIVIYEAYSKRDRRIPIRIKVEAYIIGLKHRYLNYISKRAIFVHNIFSLISETALTVWMEFFV